MQDLKVPIGADLQEVGGFTALEGTLDIPSYTVGLDSYELEDGVGYQVTLTNTGEAILATGTARATAHGECSRCLAPVTFDVVGDIEGYYLLDPASKPADDLDEDEYEYVSEDETVDLTAAVVAALVVETPLVLLCREDCKGLCPHCGKDLNEGPCSCVDIEPVARNNPFAVLKDLNLEDNGGQDSSSNN